MLQIEFLSKLLEQASPIEVIEGGVDARWFDSDNMRVYTTIIEYWKRYKQMPTMKVVQRACPTFMPIKTKEPFAYQLQQMREDTQKRLLQEALSAATLAEDTDRTLEATAGTLHQKVTDIMRLGGHTSDHDWGSESEAQARWKDYLTVSKGGGLRGIPTPWTELNREMLGLQRQHLITVVARPSVGKCVAAGTLIPSPVDGVYRPVEQVVAERHKVFTFDHFVGGTTPAAWIDTGSKNCLRVRTRMGRELVVTPEHPLRKADGWTRTDKLVVGDWIAAVRSYPEPSNTVSLPRAWVRLLAILLSEGSFSGHHVSFTTADKAYLKMAQETAADLGFELTNPARYTYSFKAPGGKRGGNKRTTEPTGSGKIRAFLRSLGMTGFEKAVHKRIPQQVFKLPNYLLNEFLRVFWWGDGCSDATIILASEGMIDDLQRLFLRFGVVMSKNYKVAKCGSKTFDAWRLYAQKWCAEEFVGVVGNIPGKKGEKLRSFVRSRNGGKLRTSGTDVIPITPEMRKDIKDISLKFEKDWGFGLFAEVGRVLGRTDRQTGLRDFTSKHGKARCGKRLFRALLQTAEGYLDKYRWLLADNLYFDEIVEIVPAGRQRVFDLSIADSHCFVANDLLAHNSWMVCLLAKHAARVCGKKVMMISKEMSDTEFGRRFDALELRLNAKLLRRGQLPKSEEKRYRDFLASKPNRPQKGKITIVTDETVGDKTGTLLIRAKLEMYQPDVLFIDGAYLLRNRPDVSKTQDQYDISQDLKRIAREFNIPVIATVQMSRAKNERELKQGGSLQGIQWSDSWGQDSDEVMELFNTPTMKVDRRMRSRLLKQRDGELIELEHHWDFEKMEFGVITSSNGDDVIANDRETLL